LQELGYAVFFRNNDNFARRFGSGAPYLTNAQIGDKKLLVVTVAVDDPAAR
jgi:hypothetical protein